MWIRSQNKGVITKFKNIRLKEIKKDDYRILERMHQEEDLILGIYSTKEKALKVLDKIHETLLSDLEMNLDVFQMPLDSEV